jgi:hypothetical protein
MDTSVTQPVVADATTNPTNDVEVVPGVVTNNDTNVNGPPAARVVRAGPRLRAVLDRSREANGTRRYLLHDPANPPVDSDDRPVFTFDQAVVPVLQDFRVKVEGIVLQLLGSQELYDSVLEVRHRRAAAVGVLSNTQELRDEKVIELQVCFAALEAILSSQALLALGGRDTQLLVRLAQELSQTKTIGALVTHEIRSTLDGLDEVNLVLCQYVLHLEAALGASKESLDAVTAQLEQLREKKEVLTEFLRFFPQLEEHKMAAAAPGGDNIEAIAWREIEKVDDRRKEIAELEVDAQRMLAKTEEAVRLQESELQDKRGKGNVRAQNEMKRLAGRVSHLLEMKSARRDATSDEDSIEGVGTYVLDALIRFVKFEGQLLGKGFGGWDDLIADLAEGGPAVTDTSDESTRQQSLQGELSQVGDQRDHLVTAVSQLRVQNDTELGSSIPEAECAVPAAARTATPASEHQT